MAKTNKKTKTTAYSLADWLNYLSREEVDFLQKIARLPKAKNPVIVNIGAGAGTSGLSFAEARPEADLYTVDISKGGPLGGLSSERNAFAKAEMIAPMQILGDSKQVGSEWSNNLKIDILFVDGDHTYDGVKGDIESWLPHVKRGGYIIFHDYQQGKWPDVKKAVDEYMADYQVVDTVQRVKAFKKTKSKSKGQVSDG